MTNNKLHFSSKNLIKLLIIFHSFIFIPGFPMGRVAGKQT